MDQHPFNPPHPKFWLAATSFCVVMTDIAWTNALQIHNPPEKDLL